MMLALALPTFVWVILLLGVGGLAWVAKNNLRPRVPIQTDACPACGHTVSSQAVTCPQCGQPLRSRGWWGFKLVIGILFALLALWFLWDTIRAVF